MDFVGRLTKMIMFCSGPGKAVGPAGAAAGGDAAIVSEGTADTLRFLSFVTPYFNPSNVGAWTFPLGAFLHYLAYELCHRVGNAAGLRTLRADHPETYERLMADEPYLAGLELPGNEVVAFLDRLLPLCQQVSVPFWNASSQVLRISPQTLLSTQALYSKNPNVSHAGETAMLYLVQIDPRRASPPLLDFGLRALDVSSVNLSHQAPAALSAISRLLQPTLRRDPAAVLRRLPDILRLTLAGIDSNDQNKSLRTLVLYRNMAMWIPVGGPVVVPRRDGGAAPGDGWDGTSSIGTDLMSARRALAETAPYRAAVAALPEGSLLALPPGAAADDGDGACALELDGLFDEAMAAMSDWSLSFLDRVFDLLRAAGEQEKLGRGHGGVGMRHTSADVAMTRNFQRIMKETLVYVFSGMDDGTYGRALRQVVDFVSGETLPFAVKDASLLCQAVCSTRFASRDAPYADVSPGLDALVPVLVEDLGRRSGKSATYRLRCLAGAVRYAGSAVLRHGEAIRGAIEFALSKKDDRVLFKTGEWSGIGQRSLLAAPLLVSSCFGDRSHHSSMVAYFVCKGASCSVTRSRRRSRSTSSPSRTTR